MRYYLFADAKAYNETRARLEATKRLSAMALHLLGGHVKEGDARLVVQCPDSLIPIVEQAAPEMAALAVEDLSLILDWFPRDTPIWSAVAERRRTVLEDKFRAARVDKTEEGER